MGRRYKLIRPIIDGGMRSGIPDSAARAATITLYIDKQSLRDALGLGDEDRIYAVLVDRAGRVYWQAAGVFTPEYGRTLTAALGG